MFHINCEQGVPPDVKMNPEHNLYKWVRVSSEIEKEYKLALNAKPVIKELLHYLSVHKI